MKLTILVADDEKNIREGLARALELDGYDVLTAEDGKQAMDFLQKKPVDLVLTDLRMPKVSGEELLKHIAGTLPNLPVIVLTGHGTVENAVGAMRHGAYDFLTKPVNLDRLSLLVKRALENRVLALEHEALQAEVSNLEKKRKYAQLIGKSAPMQRVYELVTQVASSRASVLITGESGVGKELVADAIHNLSERRAGPFIKVHCAALTETLLESELFGHEKGSFTGAVGQKKGRFRAGRTPGHHLLGRNRRDQPRRCRSSCSACFQDKTFERVGGEKSIEVDAVRVVAATNRDLKKEIAAGRFREDLLYRLNIVNIHIPLLRERKDDIPLAGRPPFSPNWPPRKNGKHIDGIDTKARIALSNYSWPGNVRELRNCIESAVVLAKGTILTVDDLPPAVRSAEDGQLIKLEIGVTMDQAEREIIRQTLIHFKGNKSRSAVEVLGDRPQDPAP